MKQIIGFLFAASIWPLMVTLGLAALWHVDVTMWVTAPVAVLTVLGWLAGAATVADEAKGSADGRGVFYTSKLIAKKPKTASRILGELQSSLYNMGPDNKNFIAASNLIADARSLIMEPSDVPD